MRKFNYRNIEERDYEKRMFLHAQKVLINNFNKVASWIEKNCPNLNGEFECHHNPYYWIRLVVENGKAYLEEGSHGYGYTTALSTTETATFSRGSMQCLPNAFDGVQFFRTDRLEEFLSQWQEIKRVVIAKNKVQSNVYSKDFEV